VVEPLLRVRDLTKIYSGKGHRIVACEDVSFDVYPGEVLGIVGESGSGKSTFAKVLAGHPAYVVTGGTVLFEGNDLFALAAEARARATSDAARKGCDVWLTELVWREFYQQILANHPHVATRCFRPEYDALGWSGTDAQFDAWRAGQTGYPIVDAAMRCLDATGWMHNRLRMIVSMFLTKDLLLPWQRGERWFMQRLVDGDLAANSGGWQWSAGTGTDAAPYFRIFNPVTQGRRFDPDGEFIRRWVPELAGLDAKAVHAPWEGPLAAAGARYPRPIVDHAVQRGRCLAMFKAARGA